MRFFRVSVQHLFTTDRRDAKATSRIQLEKRKTKKRLIDSVAILNTGVVAYHLPIRLEGLLVLQSARRPVSLEMVLYMSQMLGLLQDGHILT